MSANDNKKEQTEDEKHMHHVLGGYKATLTNEKSSEEARKHAEEMLERLSKNEEIPESKLGSLTDDEKHMHHVLGGFKAAISNSSTSEEARKKAQDMIDQYTSTANLHYSSRLSNNEATDSHVIGGYRATLSNEKSSEEAKKHAREMLEKAGVNPDERADPNANREKLSEEDKHRHHIEGGYKATLANEKSSEEAKKHAQDMLDRISRGEELPESETGRFSRNEAFDSHVIGGYKATLVNASASEEAKKHAREMLEKAGIDPEERADPNANREKVSEDEKHRHHIEGGYKATLANEKSSEEAKKHAQDMLDRISKGEELPESETGRFSRNEATDSHIIGGYRATLANASASEEAKKHAREMLEKAGVDPEERASETGRFSNNEATDSHVIGGYRATLANEKSSEEAKKHAREMLEKAGINPDERADSTEDKRGLKRSQDDVAAEESNKGKQGFASMPKEKVQEIASKGGRTVHAGEEPIAKKAAK